MNAQTITLEDLCSLCEKLESRVQQLHNIYEDSTLGDLSPEDATEQTNNILSQIEDIAAYHQIP